MSDIIRKPKQSRSIETKNKIIMSGFKLFAEKGYFKTNTAEIAKEAGVSTGIVYGYFKDKRDILLDVLDIFIDNVYEPIFGMFNRLTAPIDFNFIFEHCIENVIKIHKNNAEIHETLHSLSSTDEAVKLKFEKVETKITDVITEKLYKLGYKSDNTYEKVHLAINIIQAFSHECIYDNHTNVDYSIMKKLVINMLVKLFE